MSHTAVGPGALPLGHTWTGREGDSSCVFVIASGRECGRIRSAHEPQWLIQEGNRLGNEARALRLECDSLRGMLSLVRIFLVGASWSGDGQSEVIDSVWLTREAAEDRAGQWKPGTPNGPYVLEMTIGERATADAERARILEQSRPARERAAAEEKAAAANLRAELASGRTYGAEMQMSAATAVTTASGSEEGATAKRPSVVVPSGTSQVVAPNALKPPPGYTKCPMDCGRWKPKDSVKCWTCWMLRAEVSDIERLADRRMKTPDWPSVHRLGCKPWCGHFCLVGHAPIEVWCTRMCRAQRLPPNGAPK